MEKNLDVTKPRYSEHMLPVQLGPSLHRGSTATYNPMVARGPLGLADGVCRINLGLGNCSPTPPLT